MTVASPFPITMFFNGDQKYEMRYCCHAVGRDSVLKKKEIMSFAAILVSLEDTLDTERNMLAEST